MESSGSSQKILCVHKDTADKCIKRVDWGDWLVSQINKNTKVFVGIVFKRCV